MIMNKMFCSVAHTLKPQQEGEDRMEHRLPPGRKTSSIRWKLALISFVFCITPLLIVGFTAAYVSQANMQKEVDRNHAAMLEQTHYQINEFIKSLHLASIGLASNQALERSVRSGATMDNLGQTLDMIQAIQRSQNFSNLKFSTSVIYIKQQHLYTNTNSSSRSAAPFLEMVAEKKPLYNASFMVMPDPARNHPDLLLFRPVPITSNYTEGILVLHIAMDDIASFLRNLSIEETSKLFIVDQTGKVVASKQKEDIGVRLGDVALMKTEAQNTVKLPRVHWEGANYLVSSKLSSFNNWTYIVMTPEEQLNGSSEDMLRITMVMVVLMSVFWATVSIFGLQRLYRPIEQLLRKFVPDYDKNKTVSNSLKELNTFVEGILLFNNELKLRISKQMPYLTQNYCQQLLFGELSASEILSLGAKYAVPLKGGHFRVCVVSVDQYGHFMQTFSGADRADVHYALRKAAEEKIGGEFPCVSAVPHPGQIAVIIDMGEGNVDPERIRPLMDQVRMQIKASFPLTVTVAVSDSFAGYSGIHAGYEQALGWLRQRLLSGRDSTITANYAKSGLHEAGRMWVEVQKKIVFHVLHGNMEQARNDLSAMFADLIRYADSTETALGSLSYLLGELEYVLGKVGCQLDNMVAQGVYKQLYNMTTLPEVENWLSREVFPAIQEQLRHVEVSKQTVIVQKVAQYLREHIRSDLSLQQLSDEFGVSPSHLSRMFKEEIGRTFSQYLLELRMNKAKEWLEHTDLPVKTIADRLHYTSVTNFSRVFKQVAGTSPGKFRSTARNE